MAEADWTVLVNSLGTSSVSRGVTHGIARPPGGGNFLYGFNSRVNDQGVVGLYATPVVGSDFAPMLKGARISAAIQRGVSSGAINFAPMLYLCLRDHQVEDLGYILGLSDEDPHHIVLRKGRLTEGVPDSAVGSDGVLRKSVETHLAGEFLQLRLDAIVNLDGDTILSVKKNDLTAPGASVATPAWVAIPGMDDFVDDALGVNSGSLPFGDGYAGFAFWTKDVSRRGYFDHVEVFKQITP